MKINPQFLQMQIANLLLEYPELKDDPDLRADTLEAETDLHRMLLAILQKIDDDEMLLTGLDKRLKELKAREGRLELRVSFWRATILKVLQWADLRKVELPTATLSQHAGQRKLIGDPDVDLLPDDFVRTTRAPDRVAIKEALLRGEFVPECSLSNAEPSLTIHHR